MMNQRRRNLMASALGSGQPLTGGLKAPVTRATPGMSNPIAFGPRPVGGTPGVSNPIAFGPQSGIVGGNMGAPANMPALGGGGFQPPAPTLPPINPGGMNNPMATRPGGNPYVEGVQGNQVQPPAIRNPMVRPGVVGGNQGAPAAPKPSPYFIM